MTKEEILDYVVNSPENTNRMVLSDMLNELVSSSGGGVTVVHYSGDAGHLDITAEELLAAAKSSYTILVFASDTEETAMPLVHAYKYENSYMFVFGTEIEQAYSKFTANSGSDFPAEGGGGEPGL